MLNIEFSTWTEADLDRVDELVDRGPARPSFWTPPIETRNNLITRMKSFAKMVIVNSEKVGRIHISPKPELNSIHIGYALFPEYRGRKLMKPILKERIALFVQNEFPAMREQYPLRELTAL